MKTVIYPGSFDPITNGHVDVLVRALALFDKVIITIAVNPAKQPLFTVEERLNMIREATGSLGNVAVDHFSGLVVDYAREQGACGIIRGLRALSDFEVEYQMALMNRDMEPEITTVFLMPHDRYTYLNSSMIREVASYGRDVSGFVPPIVSEYLKRKYSGD